MAKEINEIFSKGFATAWFSALPGAVRATVILSPYRPEADEIVTWSADGLRYTWATPGKEPRSPTQSSFEYGLLPRQQRPDQEDSSHRAARALLLAGCAVHPVDMALLYRASVLFVPARRLYDEHVHLSVLTLYRLDDAVQWVRERGGIRIAEPRGRCPDQPRRTLDDIAADSPQRIVHRGPRWKTLAERGLGEEMDVARKILAIARTISLDDARVLWSIIVERLMKQADRDARDYAAGVLAAASAHQRLAMETLFNRLLEM